MSGVPPIASHHRKSILDATGLLTIKKISPELLDLHGDLLESAEVQRVLRALSATSHHLRAITLPLLWHSIYVNKVSEMGRLHETLKISPHLAGYVQSFTFGRTPLPTIKRNGSFDFYPKDQGTLLDIAFRGSLRQMGRV